MVKKKTLDEEEMRALVQCYISYSPAQMRQDQARAEMMLSQLKTYDVWVLGMSAKDLARLKHRCPAGGSLRSFYDKLVREIEEIKLHGCPTNFVFSQLDRNELSRRGGKASASKLSKKGRTERARKAGLARQKKARERANRRGGS